MSVHNLPRWMVVGFCLIFAVGLIFLVSPPYSTCDSQYDLLKESQKGFLYLDQKKKYLKNSGYKKAVKQCKEGNSQGACGALFENIDLFMRDFAAISLKCQKVLFSKSEIHQFFWDSIEVLAEIQWVNYKVEEEDFGDKYGWYTSFHLRTYCRMKNFIRYNNDDVWKRKSREILASLPASQERITEKDRFKRSLFSYKCIW